MFYLTNKTGKMELRGEYNKKGKKKIRASRLQSNIFARMESGRPATPRRVHKLQRIQTSRSVHSPMKCRAPAFRRAQSIWFVDKS